MNTVRVTFGIPQLYYADPDEIPGLWFLKGQAGLTGSPILASIMNTHFDIGVAGVDEDGSAVRWADSVRIKGFNSDRGVLHVQSRGSSADFVAYGNGILEGFRAIGSQPGPNSAQGRAEHPHYDSWLDARPWPPTFTDLYNVDDSGGLRRYHYGPWQQHPWKGVNASNGNRYYGTAWNNVYGNAGPYSDRSPDLLLVLEALSSAYSRDTEGDDIEWAFDWGYLVSTDRFKWSIERFQTDAHQMSFNLQLTWRHRVALRNDPTRTVLANLDARVQFLGDVIVAGVGDGISVPLGTVRMFVGHSSDPNAFSYSCDPGVSGYSDDGLRVWRDLLLEDLSLTRDRALEWLIPQLRPFTAMSYASAAESCMVSVDENLLESLPELPELLALKGVDEILDLWKRFNLGHLWSGVKTVAIANLLIAFGVRPTMDMVDKFAKALNKSIDASGVFHGSYRVDLGHYNRAEDDIPSHLRLPGAHAVVRTKVRFRRRLDTALGFLGALHRYGALPSFSNLYELLPFSFVADWGVGVGSLLSSYENLALSLVTDPADIVHSYRIHLPRVIDQRAHSENQLISAEFGNVELYLRELSAYVPTPRFGDTIYSGTPDFQQIPLLIAGSLGVALSS